MSDRKRIVELLLAYDQGKRFDKAPIVQTAAATGKQHIADPAAYFLAVLMDMGMPAEYVWRRAPHELRRRLGHLDMTKIAGMSSRNFGAIFARPPSIHRYKIKMAQWVQAACRVIAERYGGKPENIWNDHPSMDELEKRFRAFQGIGQKKASMAVNIMLRDGLVPLRRGVGPDVSYDVHIRRVFARSGLSASDTAEGVIAAARELLPDSPGSLDRPIWLIGREHCFPDNPDCAECPLQSECAFIEGPLPVPAGHAAGERSKRSEPHQPRQRRSAMTGDGIVRREFWASFLKEANELSGLYANTVPTVNDWIQANAGRQGVVFTCKVKQHATQVMLNIDQRPARDEKQIFNRLLEVRTQIEEAFGGNLIWDQKDDRRICRIRVLIEEGGTADRDRWAEIARNTIQTMARLEKALKPHIESLPE